MTSKSPRKTKNTPKKKTAKPLLIKVGDLEQRKDERFASSYSNFAAISTSLDDIAMTFSEIDAFVQDDPHLRVNCSVYMSPSHFARFVRLAEAKLEEWRERFGESFFENVNPSDDSGKS